jgi:hypothetical protein
MRSEITHFVRSDNGPIQISDRTEITVDEAHFNRAYDKSTFWPKVSKDALVIDAIKKTVMQPKEKGSRSPLSLRYCKLNCARTGTVTIEGRLVLRGRIVTCYPRRAV